MNKKHLFVLILILGVLGVLVTLKQSHHPAEVVSEEYTSLDLSFDQAKVVKIVLSKTDEASRVEILKEKEVWILPGFFNARANRNKIDSLLKEIRETKGEIRGKSKAVFKDFGIQDEESLRVALSDAAGKEMLVFRIGNKKSDRGAVFVRKQNEETVYLAEANLLSAVGLYGDLKTENPKRDFWAATDFFRLDPARVLSIKTIRYPNGKETITTNVQRKELGGAWQSVLNVPFSINGEKIRSFLENSKAWNAQTAVDPNAQDYGFSKPVLVFEAGLDGSAAVPAGGSAAFKVTVSHPKEGPDYFAQVVGEPVVFKFPEYLLKTMDVDEAQFFADNPLNVDADKMEKLVIRAGKTTVSFQPKQKKWEALTSYLNDMKNFRTVRLLFDGADIKKVSGSHQIEIQHTGEVSKTLEVGEVLSASGDKEYAAQIKGGGQPFAITEGVFKQLFENLERLKEPAAPAGKA